MAARRSDPAPAIEARESTPVPSRRPTRQVEPKIKVQAHSGGTFGHVTEEARRAMIAEAAYFHAERRGFAPGNETQDWLRAEAEIDALLRAAHPGPPQ